MHYVNICRQACIDWGWMSYLHVRLWIMDFQAYKNGRESIPRQLAPLERIQEFPNMNAHKPDQEQSDLLPDTANQAVHLLVPSPHPTSPYMLQILLKFGGEIESSSSTSFPIYSTFFRSYNTMQTHAMEWSPSSRPIWWMVNCIWCKPLLTPPRSQILLQRDPRFCY